MQDHIDMSPTLSLAGKTAVVIGGTGGLGRVVCETLAQAGCSIAFSYHSNADAAREVETTLKGINASGLARAVDLLDIPTISALFDATIAEFGSVDIVVYASGPKVEMAAIADLAPETWAKALNTDVNGFFNLAHVAIPHLRASKGTIIALTTAGTKRYPPLDVMSAVPKAAVEMLINGIAREEGRNGIRANAVAVGQIEAGQGLHLLQDERFQRLAARVVQSTPLRRQGQAQEVANTVLYLAAPLSSFVSGEVICVDGGGHV